jgi:hypothetical protein
MTTEEMLEVLREAGNLKIVATRRLCPGEECEVAAGWQVSTGTGGVFAWARVFGHAVSKAYQRYLNQGDTCAYAVK